MSSSLAPAHQYVSCVSEAVRALKEAHNEAVAKQVADTLQAASRKTLDSIAALELNQQKVLDSLHDRIKTYESAIKELAVTSTETLKEATESVYKHDAEAIRSLVTSLVQIGLYGLKAHKRILRHEQRQKVTDKQLLQKKQKQNVVRSIGGEVADANNQSVKAEAANQQHQKGEQEEENAPAHLEQGQEEEEDAYDDGLNRSEHGGDAEENEGDGLDSLFGDEENEDEDDLLPTSPLASFPNDNNRVSSVKTRFEDSTTAEEQAQDEAVISSITHWLRKICRDHKATVSSLQQALSGVTAEREQLRAQVALLKVTTVSSEDLSAARAHIVRLEGEVKTAHANALTLSSEITASVAKGIADHESEKASLNVQIAQLTQQIDALKKENVDLQQQQQVPQSNTSGILSPSSSFGLSVSSRGLREALVEAERSALEAAEAKAQLEQMPILQRELIAAKATIADLEKQRIANEQRFAAVQVEMKSTLYQNAVLAQQLSESLAANAKMSASESANISVIKAKMQSGNNAASADDATDGINSSNIRNNTASLGSRRWLFLSGAQNGNVTTISTTAPPSPSASHLATRHISSGLRGIGLKATTRSDDPTTSALHVASLQPTQQAAMMSDLVAIGGVGECSPLSGASAAFVVSALDRHVSGGGGGGLAPTNSSKDCCFAPTKRGGAAVGEGSDDDASASALPQRLYEKRTTEAFSVHFAGYGLPDIATLVQQNSLLVALLFEQQAAWNDVKCGVQSVFEKAIEADMKEKQASSGAAGGSDYPRADRIEDALSLAISSSSSSPVVLVGVEALRKWLKTCRKEAMNAVCGTATSAKRHRTEYLVDADLLVRFENTMKTSFLTKSNACAAMPDIDAIINGSVQCTPSGCAATSLGLASFSDVKTELQRLLSLSSADPTADEHEDDDAAQRVEEIDRETEEEAMRAAGYIVLNENTFARNGKIFVNEGTNPDFTSLAAQELRHCATGDISSAIRAPPTAASSAANQLAVHEVTTALKKRADTLSAAAVSLVTEWSRTFASRTATAATNNNNSDTNNAPYQSATELTIHSLRDSVTTYATICTELDCEVAVLRAKVDAYERQIVSLEDSIAVSNSNDVANFNALQLAGDYLSQTITRLGDVDGRTAVSSSASSSGAFTSTTAFPLAPSSSVTDPNAIAIMSTFANVLEVLKATQHREETLADVFIKACSTFRANPALAKKLKALTNPTTLSGAEHEVEESDATNATSRQQVEVASGGALYIAPLCTTATNTKCTFDSWRSFTSDNTAIGATSSIVEEELRAALETERERADYFQKLFEDSVSQREEWIEHLFTTDQRCKDIEVKLSEAQSTMVSTDEHTRVLGELESTLARKRTADELILALQTSLNARDADIARLNDNIRRIEAQMMKNDGDHRVYEQSLQQQMTDLRSQIASRDGTISQINSVLSQTQTLVTTERNNSQQLQSRIRELETTLSSLRTNTIEEAYRSGILAQMFPDGEQAIAIALSAVESTRTEATNRLAELETLYAKLARTELALEESESGRTAESAKRQRLELLLSNSEATVRSYYENVEIAMSALNVKVESLERQLASVTRERDGALVREDALRNQVEVLGSDPTTENVRRYGLAATRLFEAQMTELHDRYVETQKTLCDTRNTLAETEADRDTKVANLTAERDAYEDALARQQTVTSRLADEKDALTAVHNELLTRQHKLAAEAAATKTALAALEQKEQALRKANEDVKAMLEKLKDDNKSLLAVSAGYKSTNEKLQASLASSERICAQLKQTADEMRTRMVQQQSSAAAAAASAAVPRGRPEHRFLQVRPPF